MQLNTISEWWKLTSTKLYLQVDTHTQNKFMLIWLYLNKATAVTNFIYTCTALINWMKTMPMIILDVLETCLTVCICIPTEIKFRCRMLWTEHKHFFYDGSPIRQHQIKTKFKHMQIGKIFVDYLSAWKTSFLNGKKHISVFFANLVKGNTFKMLMLYVTWQFVYGFTNKAIFRTPFFVLVSFS